MYFGRPQRGALTKPTRPTAMPASQRASVGGVNALDPYMGMPSDDCVYTYNLMPSEFGLRLRKGYREFQTGIGSADVRTILPFEGVDPANNKLFAVTSAGIYDITSGGSSPSLVQAFSTNTGAAGFCSWTEFTTDVPETYLFVADEENGLFQYTESTGTWSVPSITGVTPADIAFVTLHKQRLWLVEKNTTDAYYLGVASIAGSATRFTFGSKFRYGGQLLGLYNWTLDGGDGVDDYLVAIGQGGDVLAYRGSDPSAADWNVTGSFFVGQMPVARNCVTPYGGELYILSTFGVSSLRDLLSGVDASDPAKGPSAKINRILRPAVIENQDSYAWSMATHPADGFLQILAPWSEQNAATQYVQNLLTKAWGFWANVPAICAETWEGQYYIGGPDGIVYLYDGVLDGTTLSAAGAAIDFNILTSFQPYGEYSLKKKCTLLRMSNVAGGEATINLQPVYDYNVATIISDATGSPESADSAWDSGLWDNAVWGGSEEGLKYEAGGKGIGRTIAIAMRGSAKTRLTVVGWDLLLTPGGWL